MDLSASKEERIDLVGKPCGLVKVQLAVEGATFEGNVIGTPEYKMGEYWVYMTEGSYMLTVKHPTFVPLNVNFRDYGISGIKGKSTCVLTLFTPTQTASNILTINVKGVSFNMVQVNGGTFTMGSDISYAADIEQPVHEVTLSPFYVGETEVTQELWQKVMGSNPSFFKGGKLPVINVSWNDCQTFIGKLNALTGKQFRLPTEAEWEFAARGGVSGEGYEFSGSSIVDEVAWYKDNSGDRFHPVKTKKANELGVYDMTGNAVEWCQDWFGNYDENPQTNPTGPLSGEKRVGRGGCWIDDGWFVRVSFRYSYPPEEAPLPFGLRLAL